MQMNVMRIKHNDEMNQQKQTIMDLKKEINDNDRNHKKKKKKTVNDFKDKLKLKRKKYEQ